MRISSPCERGVGDGLGLVSDLQSGVEIVK